MIRFPDVSELWGFSAVGSLLARSKVSALEKTSSAPWGQVQPWYGGFASWMGAQDVAAESRALLPSP